MYHFRRRTIIEESESIATPVLRTSTRIRDTTRGDAVAAATRSAVTTSNSSTTVEEVTSTVVITSTAKKEVASSKKVETPKQVARVTARRSKEISENEKNMLLETSIEAIRKSTSIENLANGNHNDNVAYQVYKEAGEYWNKFPKTDYTYSELSPHRREIVPGQFIMPNMSRGSLDKHHVRIENMIQKSPEQAAYIRERYQARTTRSARPVLQYDSGDELDYSQFETRQAAHSSAYEYTSSTTVIKRFKRVVTTFFTTIFTFMASALRLSSTQNNYYTRKHLYYTRYEREQSIFSRFLSGVSSVWMSFMRRVYIFISSVLLIDTWLLMSRNSQMMGERKRRFLLLLLFLLPLLLFGGK